MYLHENRVNGKKYIGITSQQPEHRWNNGKGYAKNKHFNAAIQKHGWHAFRHEILYTGLSQEDAERLEIELIAHYQTQDADKGYNLTAGGEGVRAPIRKVEPKSWVHAARTSPGVNQLKTRPSVTAPSFNARAVRCIETGVVYPTIESAVRATGLQHSKITLCCQGKRQTTGGYHWEYFDTPIFDTRFLQERR